MMDSIIIVPCYNRQDLLARCLEGLRKYHPLQRVLVAGTAACQAVVDRFGYELTGNETAFFTERINAAVAITREPLIVLLNDDCFPLGPFLPQLQKSIRRADVAGAVLTYPDGTIEHIGTFFRQDGWPFHVSREERLEDCEFVAKPPAVTFACVAIRRDLWNHLDGLDKRYTHVYQDVDFCLRAREVGAKIVLSTAARLEHLGGSSGRRETVQGHDAKIFADTWLHRRLTLAMDVSPALRSGRGPFRGDKILCHGKRLLDWQRSGKRPVPVTMEVDVTNACNARCPDCAGGRAAATAQWEPATAKVFAQMWAAGVRAVIFTGGGEPTLHPHLPDFIYAARQEGMEVALISNGISLPEKVISAVAACCTWVRFSLAPDAASWAIQSGLDAAHFEAVRNNVQRCVANLANTPMPPTIGVGCLTDGETAGKINEMCRLATDLGVDYVQFRPKHGDRTPIDLSHLEDLGERWPDVRVLASWHKYAQMGEPRGYETCYGHYFTGVIQADYRMSVCCHTRGVDGFCWGDVRNGFLETWVAREHDEAVRRIDLERCVPACRCDHFNNLLWEIKDCGKRLRARDAYSDGIEHANFL